MAKKSFPPEWFGDSIEILETEIGKALEGSASNIFSSEAYDKLLRARQELCRLHGADLPEAILAKFGTRMNASRRASKEAKGEQEMEFDDVEEFHHVPEVPSTSTQVQEFTTIQE